MLSVLLSGMIVLSAGAGDTLSLTPAVVSCMKDDIQQERLAAPESPFLISHQDAGSIQNQHSMSQVVPGVHIPDYGASLTSTIYIRGLGSRMENPALGLYVDDIPILDKNAYDFDWLGMQSATLLRGPQGTLYGRNSMGGVLLLRTPSASGRDGIQGLAEVGTAGSFRLGLASETGHQYLSAGLRHTDGYFTNIHTGRPADPYWGGGIHWRWDKAGSEKLSLSNSLHLNYSDEGGFAYGRYLDGEIQPVDYNDEGSYRRLSAIDGFKVQRRGAAINLNSVTSLQLLADRMRMDQDYTPESIFTLEQKQRSIAVAQEVVISPAKPFRHWKPQTGFFCFGKAKRMAAPVFFKEDGIRTLILDNANRNIPENLGYLDITEKEFPVDSDFGIYSWNAALYHQSAWEMSRWILTAGLRLDYGGDGMSYDSQALIHYRFVPNMSVDKSFETSYIGNLRQHSFQILPKISILYVIPLTGGLDRLTPYGNISKGFRAGGFNTQIFSDILQGLMMNGMMAGLGVHLDHSYASVGAEHTRYRPEEAWNYEIGLRYRHGSVFNGEINAYHIDCRNQQLTVFPPGKSTGRMMTNAGRSWSRGIEMELDYHRGDFQSHLSYSWCNARFREYNDGNNDYAGKRVPYVPEHSYYLGGGYRFHIANHQLAASADFRGAGPVRWNEDNSISSPVSLTIGGMVSVAFDHFNLYLRGENLGEGRSPTFYFKSVGNEFFALSRPRRISIGVDFKL